LADSGDSGDGAVHIVEGETHLHACLVTARLLAGAAGKYANGASAELFEYGFECMAESCPVGEQENHGGNAPGHADHGDRGAAAVEEHRLPGLAENVF